MFTVSNPCGADKGGCEQICVLSHRTDNGGLGYRCKCRMGFDLHADGKRCVGKFSPEAFPGLCVCGAGEDCRAYVCMREQGVCVQFVLYYSDLF